MKPVFRYMNKKTLIALMLVCVAAVPGAYALAQTATSIAVSLPVPACPQLSANLYVGLSDYRTGGQVTALQQFLNNRYGNQLVTGYFGVMTYANVVRFQREQAVYPVTGGVGPLTRAAIARTCGVVTTPPVQTNMFTVTSPAPGSVYARGSQMHISWSGLIRETFAYEPHASIVDLYTSAGVKVGTIAITGDLKGDYTWSIPPFPQNMMCTMQYPNGLCGTNVQGQYYIKVTAVVGNGFGTNETVIGTAQSGIFTVQ